jgi:4-methyl-5(b-hydroxyethyl)-thiazole monophosphate biosynthesis
MAKNVLLPFTEGVEEVEMIAVVDLLRRANVRVCMASLDGAAVTGRSGITMMPDAGIEDVQNEVWDMVVLPGGLPNAFLLRDHACVKTITLRLRKQRKTLAAICAAPLALAAFGVIEDHRVTSYPSTGDDLQALAPAAVYVDDAVVEDDFLITSRGPGTAIPFALRLIAKLCGENVAEQVKKEIVYG